MNRRELFIRLGIMDDPEVPTLHRRTIKGWSHSARNAMANGRFHSSFWGGMFPAGEANHCGRAALYGLMNLPETEPAHPKLMATAGAGKGVENQITELWRLEGLSIANGICHTSTKKGVVCSLGGIGCPVDHEDQLRLQDPDYWYSAALDDVLDLRPECSFVVPVDVKSKKQDVINDMKNGALEADPRHIAQVIGYIYICRLKHTQMGWDRLGLEESRGGFVYYVSRDDPSSAHAFWVPYQEEEVEAALSLLKEWRQKFTLGELPERPSDWKWTANPCKWCDFKKEVCKPDYKEEITTLAESHGVALALKSDPDYDLEKVQAQVLKRWEK